MWDKNGFFGGKGGAPQMWDKNGFFGGKGGAPEMWDKNGFSGYGKEPFQGGGKGKPAYGKGYWG